MNPANRKRSCGHRFGSRVILALIIAAVLTPACYFAVAAASPDSGQQAKTKRHAMPDPTPREHPVPFHAGEKLSYRVSWSMFSNAASLELTAPERRDLFGYQTWHFRGIAHTLNSVRTLFPLDDQFDSYTDAFTLESRQFETHLNEMGKSTSQVLRFAPHNQPSRLPPPIVVVPQDTRDPLGVAYSLRDIDWQRTPEFHAPVYDGHNLYDIRASRESSDESVKVAAGAYSASQISIRVFQNQKELTAVHYRVWIASDTTRTPVLMEAELPFGTIHIELTFASE